MLNINCSRCGQGLKNVYYFEGKPYGSECFKKVAGIDPESYIRMKTIERNENNLNDFIETNPIMYVVLDQDYEIDKNELKRLGFQKRLGYYIGFVKVDYNTISFMTKDVFKGFNNGLYSVDTHILTIIEDAEVKVIEDKKAEKENNAEVIDTIKTNNLTIQITINDYNELKYVVTTNTGATFKVQEYGYYENTKGIKGIKKFKAEFEENIDFQEMINKYKFNY